MSNNKEKLARLEEQFEYVAEVFKAAGVMFNPSAVFFDAIFKQLPIQVRIGAVEEVLRQTAPAVKEVRMAVVTQGLPVRLPEHVAGPWDNLAAEDVKTAVDDMIAGNNEQETQT